MAASAFNKRNGAGKRASPLLVRLDQESKRCITAAAELRRISVSDYVRTVTVSQARREIRAAQDRTIALAPDEQLAFWTALNEAPSPSPAQRHLGRIMRGKPGGKSRGAAKAERRA